MELATPLFGYASVLPREEGEHHPRYETFRQEVVTALRNLDTLAEESGIEREDAKACSYALAVFIDEQVNQSVWEAKGQWAAEPLQIMLHQDAEGGVNFFRRLDALGDRQRDVKAVYLVCLALGFRGIYATEDPAQQAAKIDEIKKRTLREIQSVPLEKRDLLFPDAYRPAEAIQDDVPPPPRWWLLASLGAVLVAVLFWILLYWIAGHSTTPAEEALAPVAGTSSVSRSGGTGAVR